MTFVCVFGVVVFVVVEVDVVLDVVAVVDGVVVHFEAAEGVLVNEDAIAHGDVVRNTLLLILAKSRLLLFYNLNKMMVI